MDLIRIPVQTRKVLSDIRLNKNVLIVYIFSSHSKNNPSCHTDEAEALSTLYIPVAQTATRSWPVWHSLIPRNAIAPQGL